MPQDAMSVSVTSGILPLAPQSLLLHKVALESEVANWSVNGFQLIRHAVITSAESVSRVSEVTDMRRAGEEQILIPIRLNGTTSARSTERPAAGELASFVIRTQWPDIDVSTQLNNVRV
eukprot:5389363-Amphidinium_carterae.1